METTEKNYTPVFIGVGIGLGTGLVICGIMYLIMRYQRNKECERLKAVHERDKQNSLDAQSVLNKMENLKSKADLLANLKAEFAEKAKQEPEKSEPISE